MDVLSMSGFLEFEGSTWVMWVHHDADLELLLRVQEFEMTPF
jgi:hypothetical protein